MAKKRRHAEKFKVIFIRVVTDGNSGNNYTSTICNSSNGVQLPETSIKCYRVQSSKFEDGTNIHRRPCSYRSLKQVADVKPRLYRYMTIKC